MRKLQSILLIDDDSICTWLTKSLLEELKICEQIICLSDGQSALDYLQHICSTTNGQEPMMPELILLDLNMPIIDGFEFLERINELPGCSIRLSERVVILTTSMHSEDLEKAKHFSIKDYIIKPLSLPKISTILEPLLLEAATETATANPVAIPAPDQDHSPLAIIDQTDAIKETRKELQDLR